LGNCYIEYKDGRPPVCGQASTKQVCFNTVALPYVKSVTWYDQQPCPTGFMPETVVSPQSNYYGYPYYPAQPPVNPYQNNPYVMTIPIEMGESFTQGWQAICNGHLGGWYGPCRSDSTSAKADADSHNASSHGGERYATYVKRSC